MVFLHIVKKNVIDCTESEFTVAQTSIFQQVVLAQMGQGSLMCKLIYVAVSVKVLKAQCNVGYGDDAQAPLMHLIAAE